MKIYLIILVMVTSASGLSAQVNQATTGLFPVKPTRELLALKQATYDFGQIQHGRPVTHEFEIANNAADTLKIENVQASCGCTTPVWNKEPLAPGKSAKINVGFNALAEGPFEKLVTIFYNGGQTKSLTIKGQVYKSPATSAPVNTSVELLKQTNH